MDGIVGYISLNFINKSIDLWAAYFIVTAGFFYFYFGKTQLENLDNKINLIFFGFFTQIKKHFPDQSSLVLYFVSTIILVLNVINQSQDIFYTLITIIIFFYFAILGGPKFYFWATVIFVTKSFYSGDYIINDAFHGAEHFLATFSLKNGFFSVFPNIGYLEELPPIVLTNILDFISHGKISLSLAASRTIIANFLQLSILYFLFTKNKTAAILALFCLPYDRISLLFLLFYTCFLLHHFEKFYKDPPPVNHIYFYKLLILGPFPLLALLSSLSYLIVPIFGFTILGPKLIREVRFLLALIFIWAAICFSFYNFFEYYFNVYFEFSKHSLLAYATPLSNLSLFSLLFNFFVIFWLSVIIISTLDDISKYKLKILAFFAILFIIIIYVQYAFSRIDPGYSRVMPIAISLFVVSILAFDKYRNIISIVFILIAIKFQVIQIPHFSIHNFLGTQLYKSNPLVKLDDTHHTISTMINVFAGERNVIMYADPALAIRVNNSLIPPFTSPYVTVGVNSQNKVLSYLSKNENSIIYLGRSFITYDGVDIRLRTPLIFRYLADNYDYKNVDGLIYAVPKEQKLLNNQSGEIFFNGMDLGKSALFYKKFYLEKFVFRKVYVECSGNSIFKYTIKNSGNYILADLRCGDNFIPDIYFNGEIYSVRKL